MYNDISKKCHVVFKRLHCFFEKFLSYLVCVPSFKSINRKKFSRSNFTPNPRQWLRGWNKSVGIRLTELNKPSAHWIRSHFFNITFHKLFYTYFYCLYLRGTKSLILKTEPYFTIFFDMISGGTCCYSIKGFVFLVLFA